MLRVEQGFNPTLFSSSNPQLEGYTKYHQMVMPNIAAYDLLGAEQSSEDIAKRLHNVRVGLVRSATLLLEHESIHDVATSDDWLELRSLLDLPTEGAVAQSDWRIKKDPHGGNTRYPGMGMWTATRSLARYDETTIRERYTITTPIHTPEETVRAVFEDDVAPDDLVIATATVYALNKSIKKPGTDLHSPTDWSLYPALAEVRALFSRKN